MLAVSACLLASVELMWPTSRWYHQASYMFYVLVEELLSRGDLTYFMYLEPDVDPSVRW